VPITATNAKSTLTTANSARLDASRGRIRIGRPDGSSPGAAGDAAQANVRVAQANFTKAAQDVERYKQLVSKDEISKQAVTIRQWPPWRPRAPPSMAQNAMVNEATQNISVAEKNVEQASNTREQPMRKSRAALTGPRPGEGHRSQSASARAKVEQQKGSARSSRAESEVTPPSSRPSTEWSARKNVASDRTFPPAREMNGRSLPALRRASG